MYPESMGSEALARAYFSMAFSFSLQQPYMHTLMKEQCAHVALFPNGNISLFVVEMRLQNYYCDPTALITIAFPLDLVLDAKYL